MKNPLDINATIVGPVVELRYASHGEAVLQLAELRRRIDGDESLARRVLLKVFGYVSEDAWRRVADGSITAPWPLEQQVREMGLRLPGEFDEVMAALKSLMQGCEYAGDGRWDTIKAPKEAVLTRALAVVEKYR